MSAFVATAFVTTASRATILVVALALVACDNSAAPAPVASDAGDAGSGTGSFGGATDPLADASVAMKANAIFGGCAGGPEADCHGSNTSAGGMHLPDVPPNIVNVQSTELPAYVRVLPGSPDQSYLYMKVTGDPRIVGERMPRELPPLSETDLETIRSWIEAGAPPP